MYKYILALLLISISIATNGFSITKNGLPNASVIIPENPSDSEVYASDEFIKYIQTISGANLKTTTKPTSSNNIFIGKSSYIEKLMPTFNWENFKNEGILIKTIDNNLIIVGEGDRGTIYAVYTFLEDYLGVMFLSPFEEFIPYNKTINIKDKINYYYSSPFEYRENYWRLNNWIYPEHCLKIKNNGMNSNVKEKYGGRIIKSNVHSFNYLLPISKYGKEHPEWYCERDGERMINKNFQLCLSNSEMVNELSKNAIEYLNNNPKTKIIHLSQNDSQFYCQCKNCKILTEKYGHSGALLTVINKVAKDIKKAYPNVRVETFAYQYTQKPPKGNITPEDNVNIMLCSVDCDFSKPFTNKANIEFYNDFIGWKKICNNIAVWDYNSNFGNYIILFPNTQVLQNNIKFMYKNNVKSVFSEGDFDNNNGCLNQYKRYIISKLLWNPNIDFEKETNKFFKYYYGPAWKEMIEFMKATQKPMMKNNAKLPIFAYDNYYYDSDNWKNALEHLNKALELTKNTNTFIKDGFYYKPHLEDGYGTILVDDLTKINENYYDHIKIDYLCFYAGLMTANKNIYDNLMKSGILPYKTKSDYLKEIDEYFPQNGINRVSAAILFKDSMYILKENKKEGTIPEICKDLKDNSWIDIQEKDIIFGIGIPEYRKIVDDENASNGRAMWMNPFYKDWYVQAKLDYIKFNENAIFGDIYITYRIEPNEQYGTAFKIGLYDGTKNLFEYDIKSNDILTYNTIKVGSIDFQNTSTDSFIWLSGTGNTDTSKCMFLDRIFIVLRDN